MTTKQYLKQIVRLDKMIQNKIRERQRILDMGTSVTVPTDKEKIQTSGVSDLVGKAGTELAHLDARIRDMRLKRAKIIGQIDAMEELTYYEVLTYRYVQDMSVHEIEDQMDRSESTVYQLLREAHDAFEEIYGDSYISGENRRKS